MAGYIGSKASVVSSGAERKKTFTITGATTSLTGLNYTVGKVHVFQNGVRLVDGTDYTATNGTSITLTVAAQSGDNVVVISQASYQVADAVLTSGDSMTGNLSLGDNNKVIFGAGSDLQIYHSGSASVIQDSGDGSLFIQGGSQIVLGNVGNSESYAIFNQDGAVQLRHNNAQKFTTTSTGIAVTGSTAHTAGDITNTISGTYNLNGANGTAGSAAYVTYSFKDDVNTGMYRGGADTLSFATGGSERMRIDSSGKVGIGTSSPSRNLTVSSSGQTDLAIIAASGSSAQLCFGDGDDDNVGQIEYSHPTDSMRLYTQGTERMRIDSSGAVAIGATNPTRHGQTTKTLIYNGSTTTSDFALHVGRLTTGAENQICITNGNGKVGSVTTSGSSTSYNTSSDYRLKENVVDLTGASARVNQLDVKRFNFIADDTNTLVDGFLAHEVATVVPEAIHGTKDAMMDEEYEVTPAVLDDDGNVTTEAVMGTRSVPDYQGIDQSKLVPLLTAALQEALTEIASLKTRVEALEA